MATAETSVFDWIHIDEFQPIDTNTVKQMRKEKIKITRMHEIIGEMCLLVF